MTNVEIASRLIEIFTYYKKSYTGMTTDGEVIARAVAALAALDNESSASGEETYDYFVSWVEPGANYGNAVVSSDETGKGLVSDIVRRVTAEVPKAIIMSINKV